MADSTKTAALVNQPGADDTIFEIFSQKNSEKVGVFDSKQSKIMQNFDHDIGFCEKTPFFRRKLSEIADNCDHNIDPWVTRRVCEKNRPKCSQLLFLSK
jgi:hypothetical protein